MTASTNDDRLEIGNATVGPESRAAARYTDMGNAQRLVERYGDTLRYVAEWGWLVWDGTCWRRDVTAQVMEYAKETVRNLYTEAALIEDSNARTAHLQHARRSEALSRLKAMVELAKSDPAIATTAESFDSDPWFFSAQNGTVDLRTGMLRPHDPDDRITNVAPMAYRPDARVGV